MALAGFMLAPPWRGGWPSPWLAAGLAAVFAVYAAPIVLSGSATFAGYIRLDDTATWLALTDRVMEAGRDIDGLAPSSYEATLFFNLADGYPVGAFIPLGVGRAVIGNGRRLAHPALHGAPRRPARARTLGPRPAA